MITIREYEPKDKSEVINLIRSNIPENFAVQEEEDFSNYLDTERELFYVLLLEREIAGCGGINFSDNRTTGIISWDIIHPAHRGKSMGTMLMKHRMKQLRSMSGIQKITVRTSQSAYRFYEKQGFELLEIVKDHWAEGYDLYNMDYKWP